MTSNNNVMYIDASGFVGIGQTPNSSYKVSINGSLNCSSLFIGGSSVDLGNLSLLNVTAGTVSASKAIVVDANKNISGFRSIYGNYTSAYTPLSFAVVGGASIALQANGLAGSHCYTGTTSLHNFSVMAGNSGILYLNASTYRLGIGSPNTGSYLCDVAGSLNCSTLYINGTQFQPDSVAYTRFLANKFALNQNTISDTMFYSFDNSTTPQSYLSFDYTGLTSGGSYAGFIWANTSIGGFSVKQSYSRSGGSADYVSQSWVADLRSGAYRAQLALRCHNINDSYFNWIWNDTSSTAASNFTCWRVNGTDMLKLHHNSCQVSTNNSSIDQYAQLDVNGVIQGRNNLWIADTNIDLTNISERPIVALKSNIVAGNKYGLVLGKSLTNYETAFIEYAHVTDASQSNSLRIGLFNASSVLNITAQSKVGINITSPVCPLDVSGYTVGIGGTPYGFNYLDLTTVGSGPIQQATGTGSLGLTLCARFAQNISVAGVIYYLSDARFKENISPLDVNTELYKKFKPRIYSMKDDPNKRMKIGLVAQGVAEVAAEMVTLAPDRSTSDGTRMMLDYNQLSTINLSIIQQLLERVEQLEAKLKSYQWNSHHIGECLGVQPSQKISIECERTS